MSNSYYCSSHEVFSLVDCNSFYASCEKIFNPKLSHKPIVVLSNNDGCIIARSDEAKRLGIKMGEPYFQARSIIKENKVFVFSSNYSLYGDISNRVMETLSQFSPEIEIYSIDEAFLKLNGINKSTLDTYCHDIKNTVKQWVGIPVSIGVGCTKTLAKVANRIAKKDKEKSGICILLDEQMIKSELSSVDISEIWGIGKSLSAFLKKHNVKYAIDFIDKDRRWIRQHMGVVGERIAMELKGLSCLDLESVPDFRKNCCVSRSFGQPVESIDHLAESVASYATRAAEKIREEKLATSIMNLFLVTNKFNKNDPQYSNSIKIQFDYPTNDTIIIVKKALEGLQRIYRFGYRYKKVGVIMLDLCLASRVQGLFELNKKRSDSLMRSFDTINARYGSSTIYTAAEGIKKTWSTQKQRISPCYTTRFSELLKVQS